MPQAAGDFPFGDSETARLIRTYDWHATSLGAIAEWTPCLRSVVTLMLASPIAMAVLWGRDGIMLYNDAYARISGTRHPSLLGSPVRKGWPEIVDFNDHVMQVVLDGGILSYRNQELLLLRSGTEERIWIDLDYSPLLDEGGAPVAVVAIATETTQRVLAERQLALQHDRLRAMFDQAPGFIAMMEGPEHAFTLVNRAYTRMMGGRSVVGRTVRDAVPEAIGQGLLKQLDTAYRSGKPFVAHEYKFAIPDAEGGIENHYLDFVYQPVRDETGAVSGIFAQGHDVTERVLAEEALQRSKQEYRRLNDALILANDILSSVPLDTGDAEH